MFRRVGTWNKKASLVKGDSPVRGDVLEEDRGVCRLRLSKGDREAVEGFIFMNYRHNPNLTDNAKELRKNMTREEKHFWYDFLKNYPVRFLRQKVTDNYIADFYCHSAGLIIELDGSQHYTEYGLLKDKIRTEQIGNAV